MTIVAGQNKWQVKGVSSARRGRPPPARRLYNAVRMTAHFGEKQSRKKKRSNNRQLASRPSSLGASQACCAPPIGGPPPASHPLLRLAFCR